MTDRQTIDVYDKRAGDYATRFGGDGLKADSELQHFMDNVRQGGDVLDLGCGPGRAAAIMVAAGFMVTATDASAEMIKLADKSGAITELATFDDLKAVRAFDGVWANFSLLHAEREALPRHLRSIARALRPGGRFHIAMKTGEGSRRDNLGRRYAFVTETELVKLLTDAGFRPDYRATGQGPGLDGTVSPWIAIQATYA